MSTETLRKASNPWLVLAIVCLAQFMVVLDSTVVNVALPTLQTELDFSSSSLPWVINAYTLMFGGFLLLGGRAADLFGRRRLFLAGVIAFTAASLLDGLAPSANALIVARGLQGLGAALVSPAALSIVTTTFADGRPRTRAMGVWAAIAVGGAALGLLLGGILTEYATWRWIFFVNIPIGLVTYLLARRFVPESRVTEHSGFDLAGAVTVTAGLILLVTGIVKVQDYGWVSFETFGFLAASALLLGAFVVIELRTAHPLMRLDIFRTRSLTVANSTMLVVIGGMFAVFYFATLYVQQILHLSPVQAGLGFLPLTAAIILASGTRPAADRPRRDPQRGAGRDVDRRRRPAAAGPRSARRHVSHRRAARHPRDRPRPRVHVRAADADRHHERRCPRCRPGIGPVQHVAADRRRARPRDPLDVRRQPHHQRARGPRACAQRERVGQRAWSPATTSASSPAPACC